MNDLFKQSVSPSGNLICNVDGDDQSLWMYLIDVQSKDILCDAPICSRIRLTLPDEFRKSYSGKGAPPLVETFTSKNAVVTNVSLQSIDIHWGHNEEHVDVLLDSKPISRIIVTEKKGLSIFTLKEGPWGGPWIVD